MKIKETFFQLKGILKEVCVSYKRVSVYCNEWKTGFAIFLYEHLAETYFYIRKFIY